MKRPEPPAVGETVWILVREHFYPSSLYPEFADARLKHAPAPAKATVKRLDFFEKGCKLKPTVVCVSHLRGNANNLHYVRWPSGLNDILFTSLEECITACERVADEHDESFWHRFDGDMLRPWRNRQII